MFQLGEFKKISSNADADVELPAPPESRTLTDKKGFVIFGILMLVLVSTSSNHQKKFQKRNIFSCVVVI
jgi:hypothetical protein